MQVTITVCVGSSCHVRGARDIINLYTSLIQKRDIADIVALNGPTCKSTPDMN